MSKYGYQKNIILLSAVISVSLFYIAMMDKLVSCLVRGMVNIIVIVSFALKTPPIIVAHYHNVTHSNALTSIMPKQAFDDSSSWTGSSMRLVGALTRLSERKMLRTDTPPIVVCIPCAEGTFLPGISRRHSEYGDYNHPVSQAHGEFVATTLHSYIMERFRVEDGPEHISTIGSS